MSNNRETRIIQDSVHLYIALKRTGTSKDKRCLRQVIKNEKIDLQMIEAKCKILGGTWRIHKTVNARDCDIARKFLLKVLIDYPSKASEIDIEWRTALLQRQCRVTDFFMLDIDTEELNNLKVVENILLIKEAHVIDRIKTPKGWHYITEAFDTREICKLEYVTLLRDGYVFVKEVKNEQL